ncbi:MAG: DHH family phosphoesterase [Clostridia bacterium]|nr:DHH family phosphoesterase [Clostridia bacterium]
MPSGNSIKSESFVSRTKIYLIVIFLLLAILCILNYRFIPAAISLFVLLIMYTQWSNNRRKAELSEQLKDLTLNVNTTAKTTLINSPFPLVMLETNGNMIWKSEKFAYEFVDINVDDFLNDVLKNVKTLIDNSENKDKGKILSEIEVNNKHYQIMGSYVKSHKKNRTKSQEYTTILYFIDDTEKIKLEKNIYDNDICLGIIMVDNYEEVSQRISAEAKPIMIAKVEQSIYDWVAKYNAMIIKSDRDSFYCIANRKALHEMLQDKMSILDEIKKSDVGDLTQATLSIAFSNDGKTITEKEESTRAVIDIALGRGGDQAIVKIDGKYEFFGGRTQEVEKRTKVKARMIAHALQELVQESDNVLLMGHSHCDMDAIGSAMGLYRFAKDLGKEAKVINETTGIGIERFIDEAKKTEEYADCFVSEQQAKELMNKNTLLIVVDTNKRNYVESPAILELAKKVVVVDHHRRSTDYIEDAILTFHEVYASSAAELVTEIIQYAQFKIDLTTIEMEALYAGIMLDTKNFTFKTGVRTFEACAYLRRCGVDIIKVKKWFQSDLETYQTISDIVSKSEILNDNIAISQYDKNDSDANIIVAKAADELLTIGGITASFVLGIIGETIYISGRSIGDINVQIILEKLGGGGHITLAGAQIEGMSIEDAKQELINRINEYFFEIEN